jgi:hypothetical protein
MSRHRSRRLVSRIGAMTDDEIGKVWVQSQTIDMLVG